MSDSVLFIEELGCSWISSSLNRSGILRSGYWLCWHPFFSLVSVSLRGGRCTRCPGCRVRTGSDRAGVGPPSVSLG